MKNSIRKNALKALLCMTLATIAITNVNTFAQSSMAKQSTLKQIANQSIERGDHKQLTVTEAESFLGQYGIANNNRTGVTRNTNRRAVSENRGVVQPLKGAIMQDDDLMLLFVPGGLPGDTIMVKQLSNPYTGDTLTIGAVRFDKGLWEDFVFPVHVRTWDPYFTSEPVVSVYIMNGGNLYFASSRVTYNYDRVDAGEIRSASTIGTPVPGGIVDRLHISVDLQPSDTVALYINRTKVPDELIKRVAGGIETPLSGFAYSFFGPGKLPVTLVVNSNSSTAFFDYRGPVPTPPPTPTNQ